MLAGEPEPEVTWYKDGNKLKPRKPDARVRIDWDLKEDTNTLIISEACATDSGQYTVKATNDSGSITETVNVSVSAPKQNQKKPQEKNKADETVGETTEEEVVDIPDAKEKIANVTETTGPKFEVAPEATTVEIGETLTLKCKLAGLHSLLFI